MGVSPDTPLADIYTSGRTMRIVDGPDAVHLRVIARAELGAAAVVREHPDGGVVAQAPGRRVDLRLATLAERAVDTLGPEVEPLWAP